MSGLLSKGGTVLSYPGQFLAKVPRLIIQLKLNGINLEGGVGGKGEALIDLRICIPSSIRPVLQLPCHCVLIKWQIVFLI